jgi:hypothetical protein
METSPINFERKKIETNRTEMVSLNRLVGSIWFIILKNIIFGLVSFFSLKPNQIENDHPY